MRVYGVQNIVTGEVKDVHVIRLQFCADKELEMTAALKEVFRHNIPSHRSSLRLPRSSTFRRPKTDRVWTSRWTWFKSTRERNPGSYNGRN